MRIVSTLFNKAGGRIGDQVATMNKSGLCLRNWVQGSNPNTSAQQGVRGTLSALATAWSGTLTVAQRAAWAAYAATLSFTSKIGTNYTISGFDAYVMCNGARQVAGLSRVDAGPVVGGFATFTDPTPTWDASSHTLSVAYTNTDDWAGEVGGALIVRQSKTGFSGGVTFWEGPVIYGSKAVGAVTPPTSPLVIDLGAGNVVEGVQYGMAVRSVRADGRCSREKFFRGLAVA